MTSATLSASASEFSFAYSITVRSDVGSVLAKYAVCYSCTGKDGSVQVVQLDNPRQLYAWAEVKGEYCIRRNAPQYPQIYSLRQPSLTAELAYGTLPLLPVEILGASPCDRQLPNHGAVDTKCFLPRSQNQQTYAAKATIEQNLVQQIVFEKTETWSYSDYTAITKDLKLPRSIKCLRADNVRVQQGKSVDYELMDPWDMIPVEPTFAEMPDFMDRTGKTESEFSFKAGNGTMWDQVKSAVRKPLRKVPENIRPIEGWKIGLIAFGLLGILAESVRRLTMRKDQ